MAKEQKTIIYKDPRKIRLKVCDCGNNMRGRGTVKFHYDGPVREMSIECPSCGKHTKRVAVEGDENVYTLWNEGETEDGGSE
jgi:hypothetical protein